MKESNCLKSSNGTCYKCEVTNTTHKEKKPGACVVKDHGWMLKNVKIWFQNRRTKWKKVENLSGNQAAEIKRQEANVDQKKHKEEKTPKRNGKETILSSGSSEHEERYPVSENSEDGVNIETVSSVKRSAESDKETLYEGNPGTQQGCEENVKENLINTKRSKASDMINESSTKISQPAEKKMDSEKHSENGDCEQRMIPLEKRESEGEDHLRS